MEREEELIQRAMRKRSRKVKDFFKKIEFGAFIEYRPLSAKISYITLLYYPYEIWAIDTKLVNNPFKVNIIQVSREGDFLLLVEKNGLLTTQSGVQAKKMFIKCFEPHEIS